MPDPKPIMAAVGGVAAAITLAVPLIQHWEGHASHVYKDVGGVLTVCYGHTGKDIVPSHTYTEGECRAIQKKDIEKIVPPILKISPELENRTYTLAATISFTYNVGVGTYQRSSVARDFKAGRFMEGCADMKKYVMVKTGKIDIKTHKPIYKFSQGLANRRAAEYKLCMRGA